MVSARKVAATLGLVALLAGAGAGGAPSVAADPAVIDQSYTTLTTTGVTSLINECCRFLAQTFTAGISGTLEGVNIEVRSSSPYPLHVAIRSVGSDGTPTTQVLGETTLSSSAAPLTMLITFPQRIEITAGDHYAIVVDYPAAPPSGAGRGQGVWDGGSYDPYAGGRAYDSYGDQGLTWFYEPTVDGDQFFRIYVREGLAIPSEKVACKSGGWRRFGDDSGQPFRNEGQCVAFVTAHSK
jgi:hypothetical protein